jgi:hypothetical protein
MSHYDNTFDNPDEKEYQKGWEAFEAGDEFDLNATVSWQTGWQDAKNEKHFNSNF